MIDQMLTIWGQRKAPVKQIDSKRNALAFRIDCISPMLLWIPVAKLQALNPGVEFNLQNVSSDTSTDTVMVETPKLQEGAVLEEIAAIDPDETQEMPAVAEDEDVSIIALLQTTIDDPAEPLPYHVKSLLMDVYTAMRAQGDLILKQQQQLKRLSLFPEFGV